MKETFYFSHDYNAHSDEKILKLRREKGLEGYGIYWYLIELLAASSEARLPFDSLEDIAFDMRTQCECIASVVREYKLFQFDEKFFWSNRLISSIKDREEKSDKARKAAKTRWKNADALQPHSERNATAMLERKGKDSKGEERKEISSVPVGTVKSQKENGIQELIQLYEELYLEKYGVLPVVSWQKHVVMLKKYAASLEEAKFVLRFFFAIDDPFIVDSSHSIAVFCTADVFNRVRTELIKNKNPLFLSLISSHGKA